MSAVFVHVSDIHFGQEIDDQVHINADVKQQLIADAKEVVTEKCGGAAYGILVTGDIAQSGKRKEYEAAGAWLDQLAKSIGMEIHRVQMVPGNHDLDRSKLSVGGKSVLDYIRAGGATEYEKIMNNPQDRAALFARFEDYGQFSFAYNCPLNDEGKFASDMEVSLAPGRAIRFIRLNSSLLCHGDERHEDPELMIGERQAVIPFNPGVENIVLVHHPLNWYKDPEHVKNYIHSRARVVISGHEHNPRVSINSDEPGCDVMMLAAGATVPYKSSEAYTYTYNILEFDWDAEINGLSVKVYPRAWNTRRTCFEADDKRLGGVDPNFRLGCPYFRQAAGTKALVTGQPPDGAMDELDIVADEPRINLSQTEPMDKESTAMPTKALGYEIARLRFFRDLLEGDRLRILVELDAIPKDCDTKMSQGLERRCLDALVREGRLKEVEDMIEIIINQRKDGAR